MRKLILIILLLIISIIFLKLASGSISTPKSLVKVYIVVPADEQKPVNTIEKYKQDALRGLEEARTFYSSKLQGHTFTYSPEVQVINTNKSLSSLPLNQMFCVADIVDALGVYTEEGAVNVIFVIGTNMGGCAVGSLNDGTVWLSEDILARLGSSDPEYHNYGVGYLMHEMGHAFSLVNAGWSSNHPCTEISKQECAKGPPGLGAIIPYPPGSESKYSIIGSGVDFYGGLESSKVGFNNTESSPEIWKLYQSHFINPNGDPAPTPTKEKGGSLSIGEITSINPTNAVVGDTVRILGKGFRKKGWMDIYNYPNPIYQIQSWSDSEIIFSILGLEQAQKTDFNFSIRVEDVGDSRFWPQIYTDKVLTISPAK